MATVSGARSVFDRIAAPNTFEPEDTPLDVRGMMRSSTVERSIDTSFAPLVAEEAIVDGRKIRSKDSTGVLVSGVVAGLWFKTRLFEHSI